MNYDPDYSASNSKGRKKGLVRKNGKQNWAIEEVGYMTS